MGTRLILLTLFLTACDPREDQGCMEQYPPVQADFPDGPKTCFKLNCAEGCIEWVCRDIVTSSEVSCRALKKEE